MKINRFIALAAIALLVVGVMSVVSVKAFAQSGNPPTQTQGCYQQDDNVAEVQNAPDTDYVDQQCGDQNAPDNGQETEGAESTGGQNAAPTGTPAITAAAAQKTAESYLNAGTAVKVELDDENGALVYSIEFSNGIDVKVDAMTGSVLSSEATKD